MTIAEETVEKHLLLCNDILCKGHRTEKPFLFPYKIGDLVTTLNAYPRNIIGVVHGYIYSPFTESYRVVLEIDCDVETDNIRPSNDLETLAFNCFTKDFKPVEARYTTFFK